MSGNRFCFDRRCVTALLAALVVLLIGGAAGRAAEAGSGDPIKIGVVRSLGGAPVFVAAAKGYFAGEGLDAQLVFFDSAQPIAVAAASGDIDFGSTGMTAAFLTLAHQGALKVIGAGTWEHPGFQSIGFLVSNQAYAAGLKSFKDIAGHSVAITQLGTPLHFDLARVLARYGIDIGQVRVLPLQSNPNVASALAGGQADAAVQTAANAYALVEKGQGKLLGWVGDELPMGQSEVTFTTTKIADQHPGTVKRFLAAFRKAEASWDAAFMDGQGNRRDAASAPAMIALAAKAINQPESVVKQGIAYYDPEARVRVTDIQEAIDWYEKQGMMKGSIDAATLIDKRYAMEAP